LLYGFLATFTFRTPGFERRDIAVSEPIVPLSIYNFVQFAVWGAIRRETSIELDAGDCDKSRKSNRARQNKRNYPGTLALGIECHIPRQRRIAGELAKSFRSKKSERLLFYDRSRHRFGPAGVTRHVRLLRNDRHSRGELTRAD
jgi:hypothetical protein